MESQASHSQPGFAAQAEQAHTLESTLTYRPDIEGLRAVAVLLVVIAHAGAKWLEGGFVGVDVFFVLSGYLITGLLIKELQRTGRIDLTRFYARRLQRLLPGLLLMLATTGLTAALLLAPFEQAPQAPAGMSAVLWASNFYFAFSSIDYFGPAAESNLFLHTWSLGVEEQFYLAWPALLLFLLGAFAWQGSRMDSARLRQGLVVTVVLGLALSAFLTVVAPPLGFYMAFSRAWQFALGALAFLWSGPGNRMRPKVYGALGLLMILAAALLLDPKMSYPGLWALLPSLGAALVLQSGSVQSGLGLLSTRPMQALGRVSYSWYLWHWPVLLLGATLLDVHQPLGAALLVVTSLVIAVVAHRLVESPMRHWQWLRARPAATLLAGTAAIAIAGLSAHLWGQQSQTWMQEPAQQQYTTVRTDAPTLYAVGCDDWYRSAVVKACYFGPDDAPHTAVLIGDSVAGQWFPALEEVFRRPGWRLLVLTKSACPMVDEPFFYERIGREFTECTAWRNAAIAFLRSKPVDLVVMSSADARFTPTQWERGTARVLQALAPATKRLVVLQPTPTLPFDGPACLSRAQWRAPLLDLPTACTSSPVSDALSLTKGAIARAVSTVANAQALDMVDYVCPGGTCRAERGGQIVYRDNQHLTASFVVGLAKPLSRQLLTNGGNQK
jgi:peptidoglycan/LPS O-acetylase OafA/YrhL